MAIEYSVTLRNNRLDEITALASTTAYIQFWDGVIPTDANSAPAGNLLASCACSNPIAPAASGGVLTFSAITDDSSANQSGTPTFFRVATDETGTTTGIVQGSAAISPGSGEDMLIDAAIVATGTVSVSALTLTDGSS